MNEYKTQHFPQCSWGYAENSIYLYPGDYCFVREATLMHTILGSCVSVILYDEAHQYGAMCHAVLDSPAVESDSRGDKCYKYMDCVLDAMISEFAGHGVSTHSLVAKVFGGAKMMLEEEREMVPAVRCGVGEKNVYMALRLLTDYGCRIEARDTGGCQGRKIYFLSPSGEVFLKRIKKMVTGTGMGNFRK